jgi:glycerate dehydrogenase
MHSFTLSKRMAEALNNRRLAGAAVDGVSVEPIRPENPLLNARNCLITPHIAWATPAARQRLMATTAANIANFLPGNRRRWGTVSKTESFRIPLATT